MTPRRTPTASGTATPIRRKRKVKSEGVPQYLTKIVASRLGWIENEEEKEAVWEQASTRLSERSGRTGMGAIERPFGIPLRKDAEDDEWVDIVLHEPALTADNLGLKTWASSYLLAKRLCMLALPERLLERVQLGGASQPTSKILELGSGTGLVGIAAAIVLRTSVVLTDLPEIVPNLERNVAVNTALVQSHGGELQTETLDWSSPNLRSGPAGAEYPAHSFPLILVADPLYSTEHPHLLVKAIAYHFSRDFDDARVVVELPLREAFAAERADFRQRMLDLGLTAVEEGEEVGYDDWSEGVDDELAEVRCWWSVWSWAAKFDGEAR